MTKAILVSFLAMILVACGGSQVRDHGAHDPPRFPGGVEVLYSLPDDRGYVRIGALQVKHRRSVVSDPEFHEAIEKFREAGEERGADAVVVIDLNSVGERMIIVSGEAIRWADER